MYISVILKLCLLDNFKTLNMKIRKKKRKEKVMLIDNQYLLTNMSAELHFITIHLQNIINPIVLSVNLRRSINIPNTVWKIKPLLCILLAANTFQDNLFFSTCQVYSMRKKRKETSFFKVCIISVTLIIHTVFKDKYIFVI